ncbi:hypothetical protein ACW9I8_04455 [Pseudomonas reactans]
MVSLVVVTAQAFSCYSSAEIKWINLAETNGGIKMEAMPGSFEFSTTKGDVAIAVLTGRQVDLKSRQIDLRKWYVSAIDCKNKMGKLVTLSVSGDYRFENDFVYDGGNIASVIAGFICDVADQSIKKSNSKSL